jgi:type IX secretion system PorP/SprF family membrane protein
MINRPGLILIFILIFSEPLFCQETDYGPGYQTMIINNPAFAGTSLDGTLRLSYLNFYPGNHYNFHSVFLSYDSYFQSLHGGAGFYIANDYIGGIINDLRGGLSYSYFLQAGRDLFINAGLSASFFHRGFDLSGAVFPDQIDPMGVISQPSSEIMSDQNTTVFDVGTGFMFKYRKLAGGFAIAHLTQPDLERNGSSVERLKRKYQINFIADIDLNRSTELKILPLAYAELQGKYICAGAGAVLEINYLSFSSILLVNNNKNIDVQAGFSFRRENLGLFYNYRFNLGSDNSLMPFSLIHQTGLTLSLNKVEKRIKVSTINVPDM